MVKIRQLFVLVFLMYSNALKSQVTPITSYNEIHRPQIHFSPQQKWMNDPNGMVYYKGIYHLFYQYYPDSTVWGPMHWGHATSKDLIHWQHHPIALYPDSLGYIFSGSAVIDVNNTSGFGSNGKIPMIAIFTQHDPKGEKARTNTYQNESIAYSLTEGNRWIKYQGNPVLKNPGIRDFRDPKVSWYAPEKKWVMTLATHDHVTFFSSKDFKSWTKESEFGKEVGAHEGVWECPDLFAFDVQGQKIWILMVSINPGGPNGGSATQYFTGQFDGKTFTPYQTDTRWIDYGPDDYAGVTWSNTANRCVFLGWMSNWQYATKVPTEKWRSAMTVPRDLSLKKVGDKYFIRSNPVPELKLLENKTKRLKIFNASDFALTEKVGRLTGPARLQITSDKLESFTIEFFNQSGEKLIVGFDKDKNHYFIDRTNSGQLDFNKNFSGIHTAPRLSDKDHLELTLLLDDASLELFADNGLSVMTEIFFPREPFNEILIHSKGSFLIKNLQLSELKSIWH